MSALTSNALLAALEQASGAAVTGISAVAEPVGAPSAGALVAARRDALLAAWSGVQLHAGERGLLQAADADVALLVGDWCLAFALQALAQAGDLPAIGVLADAIAACAATFKAPDGPQLRAQVWRDAHAALVDVSA